MLSPPGTRLTAESTEAMRIKCLAQGKNILLSGFEPSTSVFKIDILTNRPICSSVDNFHKLAIPAIRVMQPLYGSALI